MATKITKWTRERGGRKDFVDPTRRSHQRLKIHLTGQDTVKMRELAKWKEKDNSENKQEREEKREDREDRVIRKRIEKLRAQLHDVTLHEEKQQRRESRQQEREEVPRRGVEELRREADKGKAALVRVRTYIPTVPAPTTPKQRARTIHAKVLEQRAVQVKEKRERVRQRQEDDDYWAKVVIKNQERFKDDQWYEHLQKIEKKDKLRKELDRLCEEREARRAEERAELQRLRQEVEVSDQVYLHYHQHLDRQAAQEKIRKREELLNQIEKVRTTRQQEAMKEDEQKEGDLRYSAVRRAYARRIKQRILDKMQGKRTTVVPGEPEET
ncbi:trichohyalin-like [Homarus americanus]|uniref:Trichohyalin-plectin-homology domain-containing protein n=1 Tax=Homarus americanus TaxID=6706 RepID=A0A8J5N011_HOMAM|nr:trichohyalin-like [Homarus americanus]KAG7170318.1 hypothetical protein Hamer_G016126 [Homarus americanus]